MGVAGLWDILRPAGQLRSLTHLAVVDGFETNPDGTRGFRIGIDASIWFFHAAHGREGENPEIRTLFFRCATLMRSPFLPLFVFDGPKRPSIKRGKRVNGTSHWLTSGMKNIIEAFGFEWRTAPGEAEAELAYLNRIGVIDAVLSDDVDNFLFGATVVIRNSSNNLSGNKSRPNHNSDGRDDKNHSIIYRSENISKHPDITLTRPGLILIGLLSGGDYHQAGLSHCGPKSAHGLARCGFGESLYRAAQNLPEEQLPSFLSNWRTELRHELRTNSRGILGRKNPALAKQIPEDFPNIEILLSYTNPITSETMGRPRRDLTLTWQKEPDLGKLGALCEQYFEWGFKESIIKRFRTVMWPSISLRILRRAVLNADHQNAPEVDVPFPSTPEKASKGDASSRTPSKMIAKHFSSLRLGSSHQKDDNDRNSLFVKIHSSRTHASTDGILEYRLEIAPAQLIHLTEAGIMGTRRDIPDDEWEDSGDDGGELRPRKSIVDPLSNLRVWIPASILTLARPDLVHEYENVQRTKDAKKSERGVANPKTVKSKITSSTRVDKNFADPIAPVLVRTKTPVERKEVVVIVPSEPSLPAKNMKGYFNTAKSTNKREKGRGAVRRVGASPSTGTIKSVPQDSGGCSAAELLETLDDVFSKSGSSTDLVKNSLPNRNFVSKSISITDSEEVTSNFSVRPRLEPFPLCANALTPADYLRETPTPPPSPASIQRNSKQKSRHDSDSDSCYRRINKFPHKSLAHTRSRSPTYKKEDNDEDFTLSSRQKHIRTKPIAFSPRRQPQVAAVIEISSDSDVPVAKPEKMPPLTVVKAQAERKRLSRQRYSHAITQPKIIHLKNPNLNLPSADIVIDLT